MLHCFHLSWYLVAIILVFFDHHQVAQSEIYQPTQQEIDRFKLIQEQIRQHQQEQHQLKQQEEQRLQQEQQQYPQLHHQSLQPEHFLVHPYAPHAALSSLNQNGLSIDHGLPSQSAHQPLHQIMPSHPVVQSNHPQQMANIFPVGHSPIHPYPMQNPGIAHNTAILQEMNLNPNFNQKFRNFLNQNGIGHSNKLIENNKQISKESYDNNKHHQENGGEYEETADRRDKHHGHHEDRRSFGAPYRCYACSWSISQCSDFNCYNNPDTCTNNHFSPNMVHQADCPGGCEQFVVTDPNGLVQQWKRGCAPITPPIKRMRCESYYEFGIRIDRCICNTDWCNWAISTHKSSPVLMFTVLLTHLVLYKLFAPIMSFMQIL